MGDIIQKSVKCIHSATKGILILELDRNYGDIRFQRFDACWSTDRSSSVLRLELDVLQESVRGSGTGMDQNST